MPRTWKETAVADGLGEYYSLSLWSQPVHTIFGALAFINIPFEVQTKLFGLVILILGFWGMWKLLDSYNLGNAAKSIGSIFFLLNSFFLLLFDGGQLSLALSFSILPIATYYLFKLNESDLLSDKLKFAFWALILSIADIRIIYLLILLILIFVVFNIRNSLKRFSQTAIIMAVVLAGFNMYWLLPTIISRNLQLPETYARVSQVTFLSFSSLSHSLLLQSPHWPQNIFGKVSAPNFEFILIPVLAFAALFFVKKNGTVAFWALAAVISVFLSKGSNDPFGQVYSFLFTNIPGFSLFRDSSKFYFLIALSYSVLIAFSVQALSKIRFLPVLLIIYFIFLAGPIYLGKMNGLFSIPPFQKEFQSLAEIINADTGFSRVLWIPATASLGYVDILHPSVPADRLAQKRPFATGIKGTYETSNFLREAPYMGEIFDVAGIGYIAYPGLDPRRDDMHPDNIRYYHTFSEQLAKRTWLTKVNGSPIQLFKTKQHQDRFFLTSNVWWVIGSDSIYQEATKSAGLTLFRNALIFAEEKAGLGKRIDEMPNIKIVLNNKTELDLAAGFLDSSDLIFPAENLGFEPDDSGWWKREAVDLVRWRSFLQEKYGIDNLDFDLGGGWAIGEGKRKLTIDNGQLTKGKVLLARVMESSRSGTLKFYQDGKEVGEVATEVEDNANVRWFEVGQLNSTQELEIASEGNINVVNALAVLDKQEWILLQSRADELQEKVVNFNENNVEAINDALVSYQKINPTKYKVRISNLSEPVFLIFSQNYDGLWQMGGQSAFPVYSLLNGFKVEKDGEYIIEFEPQKYVYPGLIITVITAIFLLVLLYKIKEKVSS